MPSLAEQLASLNHQERKDILASYSDEQIQTFLNDWRFWARPNQLPPEGDWSVWLIRAGRGAGKTFTGSGWVHERAMERPRRIAMIARTPSDARDYMIDGPSGILTRARPDQRPKYEPTKRRLTWPNDSTATIYSSAEPEQIRGFSGDTAWLDEFGKYRYPEGVWDNLQFGMREVSEDQPRILITTTPRPVPILKKIEKEKGTVVVTGSSYENRANLDPKWFERTISQYEGTRLGRQEIYGEYLDDAPGALWTRKGLDEHRIERAPDLERIVVGVDPALSGGEEANETGIVVCGIAPDLDGRKRGYILDDWSCRGSPEEWARRAVAAYRAYDADRIVAEENQGGTMVESVIRAVDPHVPVTRVRATRGKYVRAEPISALYEQGRCHHVGTFAELEDQMVSATAETLSDRSQGFSFDRLDAMVWGMTHLFPAMTEKVLRKDLPSRANSSYSPFRWRGRSA